MSISIKQTVNKQEVLVTWNVTPTTGLVQLSLEIWSSAVPAQPVLTQPLTQQDGITPNPAGTDQPFSSPVFAQGQTVNAKLKETYLGQLQPTVETSNTITLGPGAPPGPVGVPAPFATPEFDTTLAPYTPQSAAAARLAGRVAQTANTYRSSFLRDQAASVVEEAMTIESRISDLQALDVAKMTTAQLLAYPAISDALQAISPYTTASLPLPDLNVPVTALGVAVRDLAMLQEIVDWLARTDILDFWYGLFAVLVEDVAAMDVQLTRTRTYLATVFHTLSFEQALEDLYRNVEAEVATEVAAFAGAVRTALASATGALTQEMRQLYESIDAPLLAAPPAGPLASPPSPDDVLDANPLEDSLRYIDESVDAQLQALAQQVNAVVRNLSAQGAEELFVAATVTYVCLPLLAVVGIAVAGGPPAAALLAGAVFVAGEELVHLVAKWLGGPISEQLDGLRGRVDASRRELNGAIAAGVAATSAAFVTTYGAAQDVRLSGLFLRELSHLVPDVFLTATADLLGRKRDELLARAGELALAAELSQGHEYGTVFDVVRPDYLDLAPGRLPEAPQLPGGMGRSRHVAETLLADLNRLDGQRLELVDGKQIRVTKRIGLSDLATKARLGTGSGPAGQATDLPFQRLLKGEPVALRLDEGDLLDGTHPGAYRALIDDVRVFAQVLTPLAPSAQIPVLVSHGGVSRTRVRRPGGAAEAFSEQTLRLLFSPSVLAAGYRRAIVGARRIRNAGIGASSLKWHDALSVALWTEVGEAAATNELADVAVMRGDWDALMWSLGLVGAIDPDETNTPTIQGEIILDATIKIFSVFGPNPLPPLNTTISDPSNQSPAATQIGQWADTLSRRLVASASTWKSGPSAKFRKWGTQVRLLEEIEPALRDVGFLTLERLHEPQALTLQLMPDPSSAVSTTATTVILASLAGNGQNGLPVEQKRPLEDVGATTTLTVQLPDAVNDPTGLYSLVAPKIKDLVLELDLRICYDAELEAAVRASRRRALEAASLIAPAPAGATVRGPVALPGSYSVKEVARAPRRILQLSLRALRDRTLVAWKEAVAAIEATSPTGDFGAGEGVTKAAVNGFDFLKQGNPLQLLGTTSFTIQFAPTAPSTIGSLAGHLVLDPAQLGIDADLFSVLEYVDLPRTGVLHGIGIAVVPTSAGLHAWGAGTVTVGSAFAPLLGGLPAPPWPLAGFHMSSGQLDVAGSTVPVVLSDLFKDPSKATIKIDLGKIVTNPDFPQDARPDPVYDVLVTLAYSPPVVRLAPSTSALL